MGERVEWLGGWMDEWMNGMVLVLWCSTLAIEQARSRYLVRGKFLGKEWRCLDVDGLVDTVLFQ